MNKWPCPLGKKSYHHGNLRQTLIESALAILKDGTLAELSLRALARKAGVSQTAPYRHFKDKEALIAALKEEGLRKLGDGMQGLMVTEKNPLLRLQALGKEYVRFSEEYPAHFKVMFEYDLSDYDKYTELHNVSDNIFECLQKTVDECLALPGARKISPAVAQFGAWSMIHGLSVLLMNQSLMKHMKEDHFIALGEKAQMVEQMTKFFSESLVK